MNSILKVIANRFKENKQKVYRLVNKDTGETLEISKEQYDKIVKDIEKKRR